MNKTHIQGSLRIRAASALSILLLFAAACGGGDTDENSADSSAEQSVAVDSASEAEQAGNDDFAGENEDTAPVDSDATATDEPDSAEEENSDSADEEEGDLPESLEELFGAAFGEDAQAAQQEQRRQGEEVIAACMAEQGFEYKPFVQDFGGGTFGAESQEDRETREYAEEFGFGLTTSMVQDVGIFNTDRPQDPNEAYVSELSDGERDAYFAALYGPDANREPPVDENGEPDFEAMALFEPEGCQGEGMALANQQGQLFQSLAPALNEMNEQANADPRIVALDKEWSSCMAAEGFDYSNPEAVFNDLFQRLFSSGAMQGSIGEDGVAMTIVGGEPDAEPDPDAEAARQEALDEVSAYEIKVAVASFDCTGDTGDERAAVRKEYEQRFIQDNAGLIADGLAG